jgi:hypothetical protein
MRQASSRANPTLISVAIAVLIAVGLALADTTIVLGQTTNTPRASTLAPGQGVLFVDVSPDRASSDRAVDLRPTPCTDSIRVEPGCAEGGCQPVAAPLWTARPPAVVARWSAHVEPGAARPNATQARTAPLSLLAPGPALTADCPFLLALPWRPARATGADRSVPRPPPHH